MSLLFTCFCLLNSHSAALCEVTKCTRTLVPCSARCSFCPLNMQEANKYICINFSGGLKCCILQSGSRQRTLFVFTSDNQSFLLRLSSPLHWTSRWNLQILLACFASRACQSTDPCGFFTILHFSVDRLNNETKHSKMFAQVFYMNANEQRRQKNQPLQCAHSPNRAHRKCISVRRGWLQACALCACLPYICCFLTVAVRCREWRWKAAIFIQCLCEPDAAERLNACRIDTPVVSPVGPRRHNGVGVGEALCSPLAPAGAPRHAGCFCVFHRQKSSSEPFQRNSSPKCGAAPARPVWTSRCGDVS